MGSQAHCSPRVNKMKSDQRVTFKYYQGAIKECAVYARPGISGCTIDATYLP